MADAYYYSSSAGVMSLTGDITGSATSMVLDTVSGLPGSTPFKLVLGPGTATEEIVKVTAVAGTTLTVTRGHDGTTGQAHANLTQVRHMVTAEDLRLSREHEAATTGVHGLAGGLVGTTDVQTLTNKDLSGGSNIFPASLATDAELTAHSGATSGVHGVVGAVVGRTDTQTLTNKTMSGDLNTFSDIPKAAVKGLPAEVNRIDALEAKVPGSVPGTSTTNATKKLHWGAVGVTTDANGYATVTHGAGFTPTSVVPVNDNGQKLVVDSFTGTTFRIRALQSNGSPYPNLVTTIFFFVGE